MNYKIFLVALLCPLLLSSQSNKKYQGLLWKISGNGLEEPSYLYGTMHVSNKVAFHLSEAFFDAIENVDVIALEGNPENWMVELNTSTLIKDLASFGAGQYGGSYVDLYSSFIPFEPSQSELAYYIAHDQEVLNNFLWRTTTYEQNFEEQTYLDLYIFQAGKKKGKKIVALEDFEESMRSVMISSKYDEDAKRVSERQSKNVLGDHMNWNEFQEDAYRKGDLDNLDTITSILNPGKYYRKNMLDIRNEIMAKGMDSLMQTQRIFTGVGAAHLPGKMGVISLLRKMGYTVEPEEKKVSSKSMEQKEAIDDLIYTYKSEPFVSDDGLISTIFPQQPHKITNSPYQEYIFADMANNAFYSIKRVSTSASIYGKTAEVYFSKVDSLLFENIPGKILSQDTIEISGYKGLDIINKTKLGHLQRYFFIYTPLEIIICKVGGQKEFLNTDQPKAFFDNIQISPSHFKEEMYSPEFGAFTIWMPKGYRSQNYSIALEMPGYVYHVEGVDEKNQYFSVHHTQYHDFSYIEEDEFELSYFIEKIADDEKLKIDTSYSFKINNSEALRFILLNKKEEKIYGEIHLNGPNYFALMTTSSDKDERDNFFNSFGFKPWKYKEEFVLKTDSTLHIKLLTPVRLNNNDEFLDDLMNGRSYGANEENRSFEGEYLSKTYQANTGEELFVEFYTLAKYDSWETMEDFWESVQTYNGDTFLVFKDTLLSSTRDTNYLKEEREYWYTDTGSTRAIRIKYILENQAVYTLSANVDTLGYNSNFVKNAFQSFSLSGDTLVGVSILEPKNNLFFSSLESQDSVSVFEAVSSIYDVDFKESDIPRLQNVFEKYTYKGLHREERLNLLDEMAYIGSESLPVYFEEMYYKYADSSAYQFAILRALINLETKDGNKKFADLILDETPFVSNTWTYSSLINGLRDSLELAHVVFPDILELTDFVEYKTAVFSLLSYLVDEEQIKTSAYKAKYNTLLRFAKVELKKQKSGDQSNSKNTSNSHLNEYAIMLSRFSKKKEVQVLYQNLMAIENKSILSDLLQSMDGYTEINDTLWNYVATEKKELKYLYAYLEEVDGLERLDGKFKTQEALAQSMARNEVYNDFDTISLISTQPVLIKGKENLVYFFRYKFEDDVLWQFIYVVIESENDTLKTKARLVESGEEFDDAYDDIDEIIEDAIKVIKVTDRERVIGSYDYYGGY